MEQLVSKLLSSKVLQEIIIISVYLAGIFVLIRLYFKFTIKNCGSNASMAGKVVLITGANAGIGFHAAMDMARRGARVILACRNEKKASRACNKIIKETGNHNVVYKELDLSSLVSVRNFVKNIVETEEYLHVLINNAGVCSDKDTYTQDRIIETMQVNYFAPFLLTLLLLPLLKESQPSGIINLSSIAHFCGEIDLNKINDEEYYLPGRSYCNSKLAILIFTVELAKRLQGDGVVVNAVHPGFIYTYILYKINRTSIRKFLFVLLYLAVGRTPEEGAQTMIHLAVSNECAKVTGKYFVDCSPSFMLRKAQDAGVARKLWDFSEKLVNIEENKRR